MDKKLPVTIADAAHYHIKGRVRNLSLPYSQIIFCAAGGGELFCDHSLPLRFGCGDVLYIAPSMLHGYITDHAELILISVCGEYAEYIFEYFGFGYSCVAGNCADLEADFVLLSDAMSGTGEDDIKKSGELYELIIKVGIRKLEAYSNKSTERFILNSVSDYLAENFSDENFSYTPLLHDLGIDMDALDRIIAADCGMTASDYYLFFRLEVLRNLLYLRPHLDIKHCAVTNGFRSGAEFEREFKNRYKSTPKEYAHG